jgi:hypothetical protein
MPTENVCRKLVEVPVELPEPLAAELAEEPLTLVLEEVVLGTGRLFADGVKPPPPHATVKASAVNRMNAYRCVVFNATSPKVF